MQKIISDDKNLVFLQLVFLLIHLWSAFFGTKKILFSVNPARVVNFLGYKKIILMFEKVSLIRRLDTVPCIELVSHERTTGWKGD